MFDAALASSNVMALILCIRISILIVCLSKKRN